jgi:hypothetical protein
LYGNKHFIMKKIFFILSMLFISNSIFAGYSSNERSKCRWYAKKYATTARTFSGYPAVDHDGDCSTAFSQLIKYCVFQKVSRGIYGFWQQSSVSSKICSRGEVIKPFDEFFLPATKADDNIEESELKTNPTVFDEDNHSIIISGISGSVKLQKDNGFYSSMRFSIWKPADDEANGIEDTSMDNSKVLHQLEIKVTDEGVYFNGNLVTEELKKNFTIQDNGKEISVTFTDISVKVPIDSSISLDDLAVQIDGDGAPDTERNVAKMAKGTDVVLSKNDFKLKVYPNPSTNFITIDFANNLMTANTTIELYNATGEKVKDIYNNTITKGDLKSIKVDVSSLPKGNYFVLINSNGKKLYNQIIKN